MKSAKNYKGKKIDSFFLISWIPSRILFIIWRKLNQIALSKKWLLKKEGKKLFLYKKVVFHKTTVIRFFSSSVKHSPKNHLFFQFSVKNHFYSVKHPSKIVNLLQTADICDDSNCSNCGGWKKSEKKIESIFDELFL